MIIKEKTFAGLQYNDNKRYFGIVREKIWMLAGRVTENFIQ